MPGFRMQRVHALHVSCSQTCGLRSAGRAIKPQQPGGDGSAASALRGAGARAAAAPSVCRVLLAGPQPRFPQFCNFGASFLFLSAPLRPAISF
jgi:hypothetical protein